MKKLIAVFFSFAILFWGCSTNNNTVTVVPAAPTNLTAAVISTTQVDLQWTDNATNETGYKIQRRSYGGNYSDIGSTGADITTFRDQGLVSNTSYTYRVYAFNQAGNSLQYSNEVSLTTNSSSINLCGVTIGTQIWSCKNLNVSTYRNGDPIPKVSDSLTWKNLTTGAWCWYKNDSVTYAAIYGKLYNWYAVNDPRGLAPLGWHVSTDTDWNRLLKYIDPSSDTTAQNAVQSATAGGAMKEVGVLHWVSPNTGATNTSGFTAIPAGQRDGDASFGNAGYVSGWWSASAYTATVAWTRFTFNNDTKVSKLNAVKSIGLPVRLVKD